MEADARTLLTFLGPIAVAYMTYSSVTGVAPPSTANESKGVAFSQLVAAPKLPSAETRLRDPFVPAGGTVSAEHVATEGKTDPDKSDEPLRLDGTAMMGRIRFAIINGIRVTEGDYFRGMRLTKVDATQVTLAAGDGPPEVLPLAIAKSDQIKIPEPAIGDTDDSDPKRAKPSLSKTAPANASSGGKPSGTSALLPSQAAKAGARR